MMTHLTRKEGAGGGEEPLCLASYGPTHVVLHDPSTCPTEAGGAP